MILVIANPKSGYLKTHNAGASLAGIHSILGNSGHVALTQNTQELENALRHYEYKPPTVIVPFGGDGTVSAVLGAAAKVWGEHAIPAIFPVHAGTMNMIAWDAYPKTAPLKALQWLVENQASTHLHSTPRYPIKTSGQQYGFVFGFGVTVNFMHAYYSLGSGPIAATKLLAKIAWGIIRRSQFVENLFSTVKGQQSRDNATPQGFAWQACLALSIQCLPLRFRVSTSGGPLANQDMCLIAGVPNKLALVVNLLRIWLGRMPHSVGVERSTIHRIDFQFDSPTAWQLDGDVHAPLSSIQISSAPAVQFVAME